MPPFPPSDASDRVIFGIDVGGTKTAVLLATAEGQVLRRRQFTTEPQQGFARWLERLATEADALREGAPTLVCASIACGGPMDEDAGVLLGPPHLPGWVDVALRDAVAARLDLPAYLMHDARAGAYAEWRFGLGEERRDRPFCFLTFATGFGLGVVLDGKVLPIPGEVGHWRVADDGPELFGKRGSLEGLASGTGLALQARAQGFPEDTTAATLAEAARSGDIRARALFDGLAEQVGRQCARLIDLFGPHAIALGTLAIHAEDLLVPRIGETVRREALSHLVADCAIAPARLGAALGDVACLAAALRSGAVKSAADAPPTVADQARELADLATAASENEGWLSSLQSAIDTILAALESGATVLTCGNGGSATDAAHLAEELVARYRGNRRALPSISLAADGSVLTCIGNDFGFDAIFSRQVEALGRAGDVLVAFSTSGRSPNILLALREARRRGLRTVLLGGKGGGPAAALADHAVVVPHGNTARIQELHTFALHAICEAAEHRFAP